MILDKGHSKQYLEDWQDGLIGQGLGIGCPLTDQHIRYKQGQMNYIMGLDNVGKTHWFLWYFLVQAFRNNITFDIWTGENNPSQSMKKLIEMLSGKPLNKLKRHELYNYHDQIESWFNFVSNSKMYSSKDLFKVFKDTDSKASVIDPFTGLNRAFGHSDNYEFNHAAREFVSSTGKTLYTSLHPRTEAAVKEYPKGHDLEGFIKTPWKAHAEGGQVFASRADDFFVIHRHTQHPQFRYKTELHVQKVKDTDTGGSTTMALEPIFFDYNNGLGFTIGGYNPLLTRPQPKQEKIIIQPNKEFDINHTIEAKGKVEDWEETKETWE